MAVGVLLLAKTTGAHAAAPYQYCESNWYQVVRRETSS
jgi:hypothetical protein